MDRKRKRVATPHSTPKKVQYIDLTSSPSSSPSTKMQKKSPNKSKAEEKRLKRFRPHAPASYLDKLERATTQRMFVIDRTRGGTDDVPEETIEMAGTTGNIYSINIGLVPSCTCPDNRKGNQCKHIVYALHKVLKAPEHLQYQLALLSSELKRILASAPVPTPASSSVAPSNRREISGDCPICFTEFEPATEEIIYCKSTCGNNFHKECFDQWARSSSGREARCAICRTPWYGSEDNLKGVCKEKGRTNGEGYVNVAQELGISGARDYSSYHQSWVRGQGLGYF